MAEWLKAAVSKTAMGVYSPSWVRIPPSPPGAGVAQAAEQLSCKQRVGGSSPSAGLIMINMQGKTW